MEEAETRMKQADARADRAEARMDRFDKQLQATAKLVRAGILLVTNLLKSQKQTDQRLNRLIAALYQSSRNGR